MTGSGDTRVSSVERSHIGTLIEIGQDTGLSPWSAASYIAEISNPDSIMLRLVSEENEIVGFVVGRVISGGQVEVVPEAEIYNIAVVKNRQGTGLGQLLLEAFLKQSAKRGVRAVWLEVRASNIRAIGFYERNGFRPVQTRPNFYNDPPEAAIVMRLALPEQKGC